MYLIYNNLAFSILLLYFVPIIYNTRTCWHRNISLPQTFLYNILYHSLTYLLLVSSVGAVRFLYSSLLFLPHQKTLQINYFFLLIVLVLLLVFLTLDILYVTVLTLCYVLYSHLCTLLASPSPPYYLTCICMPLPHFSFLRSPLTFFVYTVNIVDLPSPL